MDSLLKPLLLEQRGLQAELRALWRRNGSRPHPRGSDPAEIVPLESHWTRVLREGERMAADFFAERCFKETLAREIGAEVRDAHFNPPSARRQRHDNRVAEAVSRFWETVAAREMLNFPPVSPASDTTMSGDDGKTPLEASTATTSTSAEAEPMEGLTAKSGEGHHHHHHHHPLIPPIPNVVISEYLIPCNETEIQGALRMGGTSNATSSATSSSRKSAYEQWIICNHPELMRVGRSLRRGGGIYVSSFIDAVPPRVPGAEGEMDREVDRFLERMLPNEEGTLSRRRKTNGITPTTGSGKFDAVLSLFFSGRVRRAVMVSSSPWVLDAFIACVRDRIPGIFPLHRSAEAKRGNAILFADCVSNSTVPCAATVSDCADLVTFAGELTRVDSLVLLDTFCEDAEKQLTAIRRFNAAVVAGGGHLALFRTFTRGTVEEEALAANQHPLLLFLNANLPPPHLAMGGVTNVLPVLAQDAQQQQQIQSKSCDARAVGPPPVWDAVSKISFARDVGEYYGNGGGDVVSTTTIVASPLATYAGEYVKGANGAITLSASRDGLLPWHRARARRLAASATPAWFDGVSQTAHRFFYDASRPPLPLVENLSRGITVEVDGGRTTVSSSSSSSGALVDATVSTTSTMTTKASGATPATITTTTTSVAAAAARHAQRRRHRLMSAASYFVSRKERPTFLLSFRAPFASTTTPSPLAPLVAALAPPSAGSSSSSTSQSAREEGDRKRLKRTPLPTSSSASSSNANAGGSPSGGVGSERSPAAATAVQNLLMLERTARRRRRAERREESAVVISRRQEAFTRSDDAALMRATLFFGTNYALVADVMNASRFFRPRSSGVPRSARQVAERHAILLKAMGRTQGLISSASREGGIAEEGEEPWLIGSRAERTQTAVMRLKQTLARGKATSTSSAAAVVQTPDFSALLRADEAAKTSILAATASLPGGGAPPDGPLLPSVFVMTLQQQQMMHQARLQQQQQQQQANSAAQPQPQPQQAPPVSTTGTS